MKDIEAYIKFFLITSINIISSTKFFKFFFKIGAGLRPIKGVAGCRCRPGPRRAGS
jgi:hypothetical protein